MSAIYSTAAVSTGDGREGQVRTIDGQVQLDLAMPRELGGAGGATNPEQLFALGYSACFHSALKRVAQLEKITVTDSAVTAEVGLEKVDTGMALTVALHAELSGVDQATAESLMAKAHALCPYSAAVKGNVDVTLDVVVG
ncbi:organic hydroperoxide resistance protein [Actinoalloteichus hymeniacidonis]|uniref:Peroxiredoxin, Ohr subfamily n=1 Tax=Actinoalloteichus hymeniacidonis TaxID=340345 RepID=A0AAC9MXX7_9PSEU|nr:organic hydroperoxide resistance protein [Actinoalloteichus hymeniacidonis]AOS62834.1 peroxiredoxin, Ohr subfamily [Actinoalloteichus hymeniacidonis]MBB5909134.1 Ohr subfamily peroxiredoxin [Actinoalloteichus hymeniacidonis]